MRDDSAFRETYGSILEEIRSALDLVDPVQVTALVGAIAGAEQVFCVGVGRVMLCLKAFSKRLNHLGIASFCVGDINEPAISERDLLIVGSGSGESAVPVAIARIARTHRAKIAHIGSNCASSLAPLTDIFLRIPTSTKLALPGELVSRQPMTNLFDQTLYLLCDAITMLIIRDGGISLAGLWKRHANLE